MKLSINKALVFFGFIPENYAQINIEKKCNHRWTDEGFSGIRCIKCDKSEYNPDLSVKIRNIHLDAIFENRVMNENERNQIKDLAS